MNLHATTHGALTVAGLICLAVGLPLLFANVPAPYGVSRGLVVVLGLAIAALWVFVTSKGIAARRQPVKTGPQTLIGAVGEVRARGLVFVQGELWRARPSDGSQLSPGEHVDVEGRDGLELIVTPVPRPAAVGSATPPTTETE